MILAGFKWKSGLQILSLRCDFDKQGKDETIALARPRDLGVFWHVACGVGNFVSGCPARHHHVKQWVVIWSDSTGPLAWTEWQFKKPACLCASSLQELLAELINSQSSEDMQGHKSQGRSVLVLRYWLEIRKCDRPTYGRTSDMGRC